MAILEQPGLDCRVLVNGASATEYPDENPDPRRDDVGPNTSVCDVYIEAVNDAEFSIQCRVLHGNSAANGWLDEEEKCLALYMSVDGETCRPGVFLDRHVQTGEIIGVSEHNSLKKFRFSSLSYVEDAPKEQLTNDATRVKNGLGLIQVSVWRGIKQSTQHKTDIKFSSHKSNGTSVAEKALKGQSLSHATTFSPPVDDISRTYVTWKNCEPQSLPLAIFHFKYRSKSALKHELIIPRSPDHFPIHITDDDIDVDNLSVTELRRLTRESLLRLRKAEKAAQSIKPKREGSEVPVSDRSLKFIRLENGKEAIDLTDD